MTHEDMYKRNQRNAKLFKRIAPIVFWGCIALGFVALIFAIRNSFGNIAEICDLLDSKQYNSEQIQQNYAYLIEKYGEWTIGDGSHGFSIVFINIGHALFSGIMITSTVISVVLFIGAFVVGKWLLPKLADHINQNNTDMVNLSILKEQDKKEG